MDLILFCSCPENLSEVKCKLNGLVCLTKGRHMSKLKVSHKVNADSQAALVFKEISTGGEKLSARHPETIKKVFSLPLGQTSLTQNSN